MIAPIVAWRRPSAGVRAAAFVALAVVLTLAVATAVRHGDGGGVSAPRIVGPGAAPAAAQKATQTRVQGTAAGAQAVAAGASGATGAALTPLPVRAFAAPIARYRVYARGKAGTLATHVDALTAALRAGNRPRARAAWVRADSAWRRVGAAYGALGSLGDAIDGGAGGLPRGSEDPHWRGLRRIEHGLWATRAAPRELVPVALRLRTAVRRLRGALGSSAITPLAYATRAHEILEDVQRDALGPGVPSGSGVRATADGVAATRVVLGTLAPVLAGRGDALPQSRFWLRRLATTLAGIRTAHGDAWPTAAGLTRREREHLQGRLGAALQALSGIPDELETALPPKLPRIPR